MNLRKINIPLKKFFNSRVKALEAPLKILLVGNPNTGKTTLFNSLTKSNEHVGNWHGVTVSEKEKPFSAFEKKFVLVDLPGLYSLTPLSYEEEVASKYIFENSSCPIINICDINNLKRNLFLTLQLKEVSSEIILFVNTFQNIKNNKTLKEKIKQAESALKKLDIKFLLETRKIKKTFKNLKNCC